MEMQEKTKEGKQPELKTIGMPRAVLYYPHGSKKDPPQTAMVTGPFPTPANGVVTLAVILPGRTQFVPYEGVVHINDPRIQQNQQMAEANGAWDYAENLETAESRLVQERKKERPRPWAGKSEDELADIIVKLFAAYAGAELPSIRVASEMSLNTGQNYTHQRVNKIAEVRRMNLSRQAETQAIVAAAQPQPQAQPTG